MKKRSTCQSAFLNPRVLISFAFCAIGLLLALLAFAFYPGGDALAAQGSQQSQLALPALMRDSATQSTSGPTQFALALAAVQSTQAATITVTNTNDSGPGSLRQALADAMAGDTIDFSVTGAITLTSGELVIDKDLTISGPGALSLAVDGNASSRVFRIESGNTVIISDLTVRNGMIGQSPGGGGGIANLNSTLTLINCAITGNTSDGAGPFGGVAAFGGGISNLNVQGNPPSLTLKNCTVSGNTAKSSQNNAYGGGIAQMGGQGELILENCTISGNVVIWGVGGGGSGIYSQGASNGSEARLDVYNSTFSGNVPPGILTANTTVKSGSTIYDSGQSPSLDTSLGYNICADSGCPGFNGPGDQPGVDPSRLLLGPLQDNGGPTLTHAPLCGSAAIDKGKNLLGLSTDQRGVGFNRTFDMLAVPNASDGTDVGAVESPIHTYTVSSSLNSGANTLRQAISDANGSPGTDLIVFTAIPQITLASELQVTDCACINGLGASQSVVSGNNSVRVFNIFPDIDVSFSGLNIQQGNAGANFGGGIYNNHSNVALDLCFVSNNSAALGGGIYSDGGSPDGSVTAATLILTNSTVSGNTASDANGRGGGIYNYGSNSGASGSSSAALTVLSSTLNNNVANASGGGIFNSGTGPGSNALVEIVNSTLGANSTSGTGGGGIHKCGR